MRKHPRRRTYLCLIVVASLTGLAAASAQAEWNVNGKAVSATLLPEVGTTLENNDGTLLSKAIGVSFNILCSSVAFEGAVLKSKSESLGKLLLTGCKIFVGGKESKPCEPNTGTEKGVILTNLLKGKLGSGGDEFWQDAEKVPPSILVTVQTNAECSIGGKAGIPVIGHFILKDCQNEFNVEKIVHLLEEGPGTELWILSETEEHKTTIDGSLNTFLIGAHTGLKWSGT